MAGYWGNRGRPLRPRARRPASTAPLALERRGELVALDLWALSCAADCSTAPA
jgi:hypothetical protein